VVLSERTKNVVGNEMGKLKSFSNTTKETKGLTWAPYLLELGLSV